MIIILTERTKDKHIYAWSILREEESRDYLYSTKYMVNILKPHEKLSQKQIKEINKANILNAFREKKTLQKSELKKMLGISITTVTNYVNELIKEGYIKELGIAKSTGGRKPKILEFNEDSKYSIGVDISPHNVRFIITNLSSEIIDKGEFIVEKNQRFEDILDKLMKYINRLLKKNDINKNKCLGIGLSLPGIVDESNLILKNAPNLAAHNFDLKPFEEEIGLNVYIENEANSAVFAEMILGSAKEYQNAVYVSITDGVGCGIMIANKIYKSVFKKAGEFGHMRISDADITCSCGRKGCWELFASQRALIRFYNDISEDPIDTIEEFFEKYKESNQKCQPILEKYLGYLKIGLENVVLVLDPELIIIGGEAIDFILKEKKNALEYFTLESSLSDKNKNIIKFSDLGSDSSLLGASLIPLVKIFKFS